MSVLYFVGCSAAARFTNTGKENGTSTENISKSTSTSIAPGKALLTVEGVASFYSYGFDKKKTASGEIFDKDGLTAAHREFPFGTILRVTNLTNGKDVTVTVNDRGPFDKSRIIDLSEGAAREIGMIQDGTTKVKIEVLKWGQSPK
ncbi:MAG TPA: septal ring lytic transglycosylase RlpA family protein [Candidatus Acidoferrales bacterium]|nr:septal ring lytic transglycosylase RlpA family protein [Candidatus Acidoferrales bacterium]